MPSTVVKHRANRGETRGLSFYRDRSGAEVDLVIERPGGLTLVEAKAARTAGRLMPWRRVEEAAFS